MIQIQLQPEIEAQLAAEARARGMALEEYIAEKLGDRASRDRLDRESLSAAAARIREIRKGARLDGLKIKDLVNEGRRF